MARRKTKVKRSFDPIMGMASKRKPTAKTKAQRPPRKAEVAIANDLPLPSGYLEVLEVIKKRVHEARIRASLSVNRELIILYWEIGHLILQRQEIEGWGAKVIDRLSVDLNREFPDQKGFSARNLKYMRKFAENYPDMEIVQQAAAQIPWFHNCATPQGPWALPPTGFSRVNSSASYQQQDRLRRGSEKHDGYEDKK